MVISTFRCFVAVLLTLVLPTIGYSQPLTDTIRLYFNLNEAAFTTAAQSKLDSLGYADALPLNKQVTIVGYADYLGDATHNDLLSQKRAAYVQSYLLTMGLKKANIKLCIGKGEVTRNMDGSDGYAPDRRVDIVFEGKPAKPKPAPKPINPTDPISAKIIAANPGQSFQLEKIYFYAGRHVVREESIPELDKLLVALQNNPTVKIQVEGHVCCVRNGQDALDEDTHEMSLSENRAKWIYKYLINKGISAKRLTYRGFGRSKPIVAVEYTAEDEDLNRRVEVRVLSLQ